MKDWKRYEMNALDYLRNKNTFSQVVFILKGGSDSNESDIEVTHNKKKLFSIDAKLSPSQCGQIVLIEKEHKKLVLSPKMKFINEFSGEILNHINNMYSYYFNTDKSFIELCCEKFILNEWVKQHYKNKDCLFFITSNEMDGYHSIIPIDLIHKYFTISAVIRRKRSGTRQVAKKDLKNAIKQTSTHLKKCNIEKYNLFVNEESLLLLLNEEITLVGESRRFENYFISDTENKNIYKIKVRAKTNNINVVFRLEYTGEKKNIGLEDIKTKINQLI